MPPFQCLSGNCTHVHLDNTSLDSSGDLILGRSRTTVEDKEYRSVIVRLELFLDVSLVLLEEFRAKLDVAGWVDGRLHTY